MTPASFYPVTRSCVLCHRAFASHAHEPRPRCGSCAARRREKIVDIAIAATVFGCLTLLVLTLLSAITGTA